MLFIAQNVYSPSWSLTVFICNTVILFYFIVKILFTTPEKIKEIRKFLRFFCIAACPIKVLIYPELQY